MSKIGDYNPSAHLMFLSEMSEHLDGIKEIIKKYDVRHFDARFYCVGKQVETTLFEENTWYHSTLNGDKWSMSADEPVRSEDGNEDNV